jgi:hypothetical protein
MPIPRFALVALILSLLATCLVAAEPIGDASPRWWKGNLHTHTLWSDGDDFPEMIAGWYQQHGYHFLALSDHNLLQQESKWVNATTNQNVRLALGKYLPRYGNRWVEQREEQGQQLVRLKPLNEFRTRFESPDRFLLIQSEEITDRYLNAPVHINVTNVREAIKPLGGNSVLEVMQNNIAAIFEQRKRTGQPMFPHLNHPNFGWGVTAEELMQVKGERFFEVYNGHPTVHNEGDATHASMDKLWDIVLTRRLTELGLEPLFGLATDDSHHYHTNAVGKSNSGRGWVMVRAPHLTPERLIAALEAGDFYASSGVRLKDVQRETNRLALEIDGEQGVTYTTQFIGTRKGFDPKNEPVRAPNGEALRVTHRYSADIGAVLAEVKGLSASYRLKGDEIYVRAKIISSKLKVNPGVKDEVETAWIQPLVTGVK